MICGALGVGGGGYWGGDVKLLKKLGSERETAAGNYFFNFN